MEVYLTHYLLLSLIKSDKVPILYSPVGLGLVLFNSVAIQFGSIEGYLLTAGNFTLTIGLCAVVIRLLNQNVVLKKVLNIR